MQTRFFTSYSGVRLPLKLVNELDEASVEGRITYFKADYDDTENLVKVEKVVYGEIEFSHVYDYFADGKISRAEINETDERPRVLVFAEDGSAQEQ